MHNKQFAFDTIICIVISYFLGKKFGREIGLTVYYALRALDQIVYGSIGLLDRRKK